MYGLRYEYCTLSTNEIHYRAQWAAECDVIAAYALNVSKSGAVVHINELRTYGYSHPVTQNRNNATYITSNDA